MRFQLFLASQEWVAGVEEYCTCVEGAPAKPRPKVHAVEELRASAEGTLSLKDWTNFVEREEESLLLSSHQETCSVHKISAEGAAVASLEFDAITVRSFQDSFACSFDSDVHGQKYTLLLTKDKRLWMICEDDFAILLQHEQLMKVLITPVEASKKRKRDEANDDQAEKLAFTFTLCFAQVTLTITSDKFTRRALEGFFASMQATLGKREQSKPSEASAALEVLRKVGQVVPNCLLFLQSVERPFAIQASLGWAMLNKRVQHVGARKSVCGEGLSEDMLIDELLRC